MLLQRLLLLLFPRVCEGKRRDEASEEEDDDDDNKEVEGGDVRPCIFVSDETKVGDLSLLF